MLNKIGIPSLRLCSLATIYLVTDAVAKWQWEGSIYEHTWTEMFMSWARQRGWFRISSYLGWQFSFVGCSLNIPFDIFRSLLAIGSWSCEQWNHGLRWGTLCQIPSILAKGPMSLETADASVVIPANYPTELCSPRILKLWRNLWNVIKGLILCLLEWWGGGGMGPISTIRVSSGLKSAMVRWWCS